MVIDTDPLRKRVEVEDEKCARVDVRGTSWDVESWRSAKNASLARATPARLPWLRRRRRWCRTQRALWRRRADGREAGRASGFDGGVGARGDDGDDGGARNAPVAAAAC